MHQSLFQEDGPPEPPEPVAEVDPVRPLHLIDRRPFLDDRGESLAPHAGRTWLLVSVLLHTILTAVFLMRHVVPEPVALTAAPEVVEKKTAVFMPPPEVLRSLRVPPPTPPQTQPPPPAQPPPTLPPPTPIPPPPAERKDAMSYGAQFSPNQRLVDSYTGRRPPARPGPEQAPTPTTLRSASARTEAADAGRPIPEPEETGAVKGRPGPTSPGRMAALPVLPGDEAHREPRPTVSAGPSPRPGTAGPADRPSIASSLERVIEERLAQGVTGAPTGTGQQMGSLFFDPQGADFTGWINHFTAEVYRNWIIPQPARFGVQGKVEIEFTVERDGSISRIEIVKPSHTTAFDNSSRNALRSSRLQVLPNDYRPDRVTIRVTFLYNMFEPADRRG